MLLDAVHTDFHGGFADELTRVILIDQNPEALEVKGFLVVFSEPVQKELQSSFCALKLITLIFYSNLKIQN